MVCIREPPCACQYYHSFGAAHPSVGAGCTEMTCPQLSYPRDSGSYYPLHVLLVSAGISCGMYLYRGEPCTMHVHTCAPIHTLIQPSAPEHLPPLPQQTCLARALSQGSRGMQRQAGKGPQPESQSLKQPIANYLCSDRLISIIIPSEGKKKNKTRRGEDSGRQRDSRGQTEGQQRAPQEAASSRKQPPKRGRGDAGPRQSPGGRPSLPHSHSRHQAQCGIQASCL